MSGEDPSGKLVRGTWTPAGDGVREVAVTSEDHGKSWKPWFDLMFRPERGPERETDAKKMIEDLDRRYQEAVKKNDAATMDQILADNFALVVGSGKVFRKADLLEEARSGRYQYERQDDSEQSVRIWGDTAVITAKLKAVGTESGKTFEYELWFSDMYRKTPEGWKYVFGQASLPLGKR
jgi:ketosteroid isomerase-like protein